MFKKILSPLSTLLFFIGIFFFTSNTIPDPDMWWHIKSGEIIATHGIIQYDVLSQAGANRHWYPYEWLFQLGVYEYVHIFGLSAVRYLVGFLATLQVLLFFTVIRIIWKVSPYTSLFIGLCYSLLLFTSFTLRPQIITYSLFLLHLLCILLFVYKKKNLLIVTMPIVYVWTMIHASVILAPISYILYAIATFFLFRYTGNTEWLTKTKTLLVFLLAEV